MEQIKFSAPQAAFCSSAYNVRRFDDAMRRGEYEDAMNSLIFCNVDNAMDEGENPWVRVGTAEITVTMLPNLDLREVQIKQLEAALQAERAESRRKQTALLAEINKLKAIEYQPA